MAVTKSEKPWAKCLPSVKEKCMKDAAVIVFQGKNQGITYANGEAKPSDEPQDTYMPFIVRGRDDVFHAETVRKSKGYTIVAVEHLDNLARAKPDEARVIATLIQRITASPEVERKLEEANEKIAGLEAKLAEVQGANPKSSELKAAKEAQAAAEAEAAKLREELAKLQAPAPTSGNDKGK